MLIQETHIDATQGCIVGESDPYEPFTADIRHLFRDLQQEYGRCVSRVYIDWKDGKARPVGWVFQKRQRYTDCNQTYLMETWVTCFDAPDTVIRERHYHYLDA